MCFLCLHAWSRTHEEKGRGAAIRRKNPMRVSPFVIRAHTCSRILRACPNRESNLLCPKPRLFGHPLFADMNKICSSLVTSTYFALRYSKVRNA
ncbi:hypothetical protein CC2G_002279 [Coprinopsis cinerea AmutBmut pab1-1]|nr:hypothetical protein CC2G_002279 [Coprinopsis cinerea AmutBmut pab1-1]